MSELVVGHVQRSYPIRRNIIGVAPQCRYVEVADLNQLLYRTGRKLNHVVGREHAPLFNYQDWHQQVRGWPMPAGVQLLHLFNQVSTGHLPWVTSFETTVPRLQALLHNHHGEHPSYAAADMPPAVLRSVRSSLALLASRSCKALLALSDCSALIEQALTTQFPQWHEALLKKTVVLPPPQAKLIDSMADKPRRSPRINFLFVGASFFRKGGVEMVETFAQLVRDRNYPIHLTVVSNLEIDNYATHETSADQTRMRSFIDANQDWLTYHPRLDNDAVLQLMRNSDVGLLPTYADTYGFVVLEFQAAGCPVITTDVRALPEINDEQRGWLIRVPKNNLGEAIYTTVVDRRRISIAIRTGLRAHVEQIVANPKLIAQKGARALQYIADQHDPTRIGEYLRQIYVHAVKDK